MLGLAVLGLAVLGLAVLGLAMLGLAMLGLAVLGLAVLGLAVLGLAVLGSRALSLPVRLVHIRPRQPIHPPPSRQWLSLRPHLVQRFRLEQVAVPHHITRLEDRSQVGERIPVEDDQVGQLACFDRSEIAIKPDRPSPENRAHAEHVMVRHYA